MSVRRFSPFTIGPFTVIPEGEPHPVTCGIPLVLGKKGAFGSGEHETTASCLELLSQVPGIRGCRALDLGTGTGILAIAAASLGAASVAALDLEWPAARSCAENVSLNHAEARVHTICGELSAIASHPFDLVMANIYADILLPLAGRLVELTRPGGHLLLSGIPLQDKFDIQRCYCSCGCTVADSRIMEDYTTYLMHKPR
ncbi:MAG TPA: 50S ribosomal protein L11 methyltransferase [Desulfuromonadaceae bacterium]